MLRVWKMNTTASKTTEEICVACNNSIERVEDIHPYRQMCREILFTILCAKKRKDTLFSLLDTSTITHIFKFVVGKESLLTNEETVLESACDHYMHKKCMEERCTRMCPGSGCISIWSTKHWITMPLDISNSIITYSTKKRKIT